jgi:GT2 family glycosyltransferase
VTGTLSPARTVSVVICAYTTERWEDLCRSVESVLMQDVPVLELIVVIDHCQELLDLSRGRFTDPRVSVLHNVETQGLSGARNTGVGAARGDIVAVLDDDAQAAPDWASALIRHYQDDDVAGVGGYATPVWPGLRPPWMPKEFDWVVGCSYVGQPTSLAPVRNPIGCNMSLRRSVFGLVGGFRSEVGRVGSTPVGGEETELCIRIRSTGASNKILFDPEMVVQHHVSLDRTVPKYFVRRCYHEGLSKAVVTELAKGQRALSTESEYVRSVLPRAVVREVTSLTGAGLARAAMIVVGLVVTTAGYGRAKASRAVRRRHLAPAAIGLPDCEPQWTK